MVDQLIMFIINDKDKHGNLRAYINTFSKTIVWVDYKSNNQIPRTNRSR